MGPSIMVTRRQGMTRRCGMSLEMASCTCIVTASLVRFQPCE
jgi:hypothetical protein